jgi:hypothetical protein
MYHEFEAIAANIDTSSLARLFKLKLSIKGYLTLKDKLENSFFED